MNFATNFVVVDVITNFSKFLQVSRLIYKLLLLLIILEFLKGLLKVTIKIISRI